VLTKASIQRRFRYASPPRLNPSVSASATAFWNLYVLGYPESNHAQISCLRTTQYNSSRKRHQDNALIWNWKVLKCPKNQGLWRDWRKTQKTMILRLFRTRKRLILLQVRIDKMPHLDFFDSHRTILERFQPVVSL